MQPSKVPPNTDKRNREDRVSAATDLAVFADATVFSEIPIVNVIGAVILLPFVIFRVVTAIWPALRWVSTWLDYRRYLNGSFW